MKILSFKVYTDSAKGYREGVPRLLDAFNEHAVEGSFFFGMGNEGTGSTLSKFFGEEREIVASAPGILRDASRRGQDCGLYGWNPQEWQARLEKMQDTTLEADVKRSIEYFTRRIGFRPKGFAAPGCRLNYITLRIQDDVRFLYCSDTYGFFPYLPKMSWKTFKTPQIPMTLPPLEVVMSKLSEADVRKRFLSLLAALPEGLSVLGMNSAVGTVDELYEPLRDFLMRASDAGVKFIHMASVAESIDFSTLPSCEVKMTSAFGISKEVALQIPE